MDFRNLIMSFVLGVSLIFGGVLSGGSMAEAKSKRSKSASSHRSDHSIKMKKSASKKTKKKKSKVSSAKKKKSHFASKKSQKRGVASAKLDKKKKKKKKRAKRY